VKVRVLCDISDHQWSYVAGEEREMESAQAARWIKAGWAESLEGRGAPETATLTGGSEQAVQPPGRRKPA